MLGGIEKFLFGNFAKMPPAVRVITYFFVLLLWAYLLLIPRFINGQLVVESKSGGLKPYRGGLLQMHVDGRVLKFKVNEEGYWSVPNISLLPHTVRLEVLHIDADEWFPVRLQWHELWTHGTLDIAVVTEPPSVKRLRVASPPPMALALRWLAPRPPAAAEAGELKLPPSLSTQTLAPAAMKAIEAEVVTTVARVTGRNPRTVTPKLPLSGPSAPRYSERIEIIERLERTFSITIPDEHWNYLNTVGELVDYIQKRSVYRRSLPASREPVSREPRAADPSAPTPAVRPGGNLEQRPVFKR